MIKTIFYLGCVLALISCTSSKNETVASDLLPYKVVKVFPHDVTAFTQGLTIDNGKLFESTGQEGSWISEVNIATGVQSKKVILDKQYFGEGITILNGKVYQLTWQHKTGFVYKLSTFEKIGEFKYDHEGWGITSDGKSLIVSDGTDVLHFLDTTNLKEFMTVAVKRNGEPVSQLNELELIDGYVFANQWQTSNIFRIDPQSGNVTGTLDLSSLKDEILKFQGNPDVLNGIAYEKNTKTILVTGKLWPVLFALRLTPAENVQSSN
jgi:glutaminyl-peptide cyclotransferase